MRKVVKTIEFNYKDGTREIISGAKFRELWSKAMTKYCDDGYTYTITKCWFWLDDDFDDDMIDCRSIQYMCVGGYYGALYDISRYDDIIDQFNASGVLPKKLDFICNKEQYENSYPDN